MATKSKPQTGESDGHIARTLRMAVKIGEDYVTIEETITLPVGASDAQIQEAVDLGWRIYTQQRDAAEAQILEARESYGGDNERPALPSQRQRISDLQQRLTWDDATYARFVAERGWDMATLTRQQASQIVQLMRRVYDDYQRQNAPANRRQISDLQRLATRLNVDINGMMTRQYGDDVTIDNLTYGEAAQLMQALEKQRRDRGER
jgi:hypothetical protein